MLSRIVRQPNGLLARFSTIGDWFTHWDMTVEEAIEICLPEDQECGRGHAEAQVQRGLADEMTSSLSVAARSDDGLNRWRECLNDIALRHGEKARREMVREILGNG